ncbi:MAG: hypothetical protein IJT25_03105 [Clostridia bacterium]|nr:hypothetical protein [Clostridia bacterium]
MRKFLTYILTFALVFVIAMATTITLLSPKNYGVSANLGASGASSNQVVSKMLTYFQSLKTFEASATVSFNASEEADGDREENSNNIKYTSLEGEEEITNETLKFNIKADISSLTSPKIYASIENKKDVNINATIIYDGTDLYIELNGKKFSFSGETLENALQIMLGLISTQNFSMESLVDGIDIGAIMGALNAMKETLNEETGEIKSTLNMEGLGSVDIITDEEYNLKAIRIYNLEIINSPIEFVLNLNKTDEEETIISAPENKEDYLSITSLVSCFKNTFSLSSFTISPSVMISAFGFNDEFNFNILSDAKNGFKEINFYETQNSISAVLRKENGAYTSSINNINFKIGENLINDFIDYILKNESANKIIDDVASTDFSETISSFVKDDSFGMDIVKEKIISKIKEISLPEILNSLTKLDILENSIYAEIDLSNIKALETNAKISLLLETNGKILTLAKIKANFNDNEICASVKIDSEIKNKAEIDESKIFDLDSAINKIDSLKNLSCGTGEINACVNDNGKVYNISSKISADAINKQASVSLLLSGEINKDLSLAYKNNTLYAKTSDVGIKINKNDILSILNKVDFDYSSLIDFYYNEVCDLILNYKQTAKNTIEENIQSLDLSPNIIKEVACFALENKDYLYDLISCGYLCLNNIETFENGFKIKLDHNLIGAEDDICVRVSLSENDFKLEIENLNAYGKNICASVYFDIKNADISEINEDDYFDIINAYNKILNVKNIKNGEASVNLIVKDNGEIQDALNASFKFDILEKYISAVADVFGQYNLNAKLILDNSDVLLKLNDIGISFSTDELLSILNEFGFELNIEEKLNDILSSGYEIKDNIISLVEEKAKELKQEDLLKLAITFVKEIKVSASEIKIVLNGAELGQADDLIIDIVLKENVIYSIKIENLKLFGKEINLKLALEEKEIEKDLVNNLDYLNLTDLKNRIKTITSSSSGELTASGYIYKNESLYSILSLGAKFDLEENYLSASASIMGNTYKDASIILEDSLVLAKINGVKLKLDLNELSEIFSLLNLNINLEDLKESLFSANLNSDAIYTLLNKEINRLGLDGVFDLDYLNALKNISLIEVLNSVLSLKVNKTQIKIVLSGKLFGQEKNININIRLLNSAYTSVEVLNLKTSEDNYVDLMLTCEAKDILKTEINASEYLNIEKILNSSLSLKDARSGNININATILENNVVYQNIDASVDIDYNNAYAKIVAILDGKFNLSGSATLHQNNVYIDSENISVKLALNEIVELLSENNIDITSIIADFVSSLNLEEKKAEFKEAYNNENLEEILEKVLKNIKSLKIDSSQIKIVLNGKLLSQSGNITLIIRLNDSAVKSIKVENIAIFGKTIFAEISLEEKDIIEAEIDENKYLNIADVYNENKDIINTTSGSGTIKVSLENESGIITHQVNAELIIDYLNNYFAIDGNVSGTKSHALNFVYDSGTAYLKYEGLNIKINIDELKNLLLKFGIDLDETLNNSETKTIDEILNTLDSYNISTTLLREIIDKLHTINIDDKENLVKDVYISSSTINVVLSGSVINQEKDINITLTLENNKLSEIVVYGIELNGQIVKVELKINNLNSILKKTINEEEYLDVVSITNNLYSLKDLTNLSLAFSGVLVEGTSESYSLVGSLKLKTSETEYSSLEERIVNFVNSSYLSLNASLGGKTELKADINLYDETLYIHLNETYIKITRKDLYDLVGIPTSSRTNADAFVLEKLNSYGISEKINGILNSNKETKIDAVDLINKLNKIRITSNSSVVVLNIDGSLVSQEKELTIKLFINEKTELTEAEVLNLKIEDNSYVGFTINLDTETEIEEKLISNADNYFDLTTGYNNILNTLSLARAEVSANIGVYSTARSSYEEKTINKANGYAQTASVSMEKISDSISHTLNHHGKVSLSGILDDANLEANYKDDVLYISYKGNKGNSALKFKLNKANIDETVLSICELFMDASGINGVRETLDNTKGFMEGAGLNTIIDLTDLQLINLINKLTAPSSEETISETENPITFSEVVDILNGIVMNKNGLSILIPESVLNTSTKLKVVADYDETKIKRLALIGLDTSLLGDNISDFGIGLDLNNKFIDISVSINQTCSQVASPSGSFMDFNGISTLVKGASKAFKENKGFMLSGKISMKLLGLNVSWLTDTDVDVVIKINYTKEDGLELYVELNDIPTTTLVFNGYKKFLITRAYSSKNSKIYYKNDRIYVTRTTTGNGTKTIKYSMTKDWCFAHIDTVLGYLLDFNSTIQSKITESLNKQDANAPACVIENILKSFSGSVSGTTGTYNLTVSGSALAQDTMVGDMALTIKMNTSTLKINSVGISMAFVSVLDLSGTLNLTTYTNKQSISFATSGYTFKG